MTTNRQSVSTHGSQTSIYTICNKKLFLGYVSHILILFLIIV